MIELCDDCDYSVIVADFIATLMTLDKDDKRFCVRIWISNTELPFKFDSDCHFDFLQEGIRVEENNTINYIFYDLITCIEVKK